MGERAQHTHCDAGCQKAFKVESFVTGKLPGGIEKVYFQCPHCGKEYVVFYSDEEIRKLQARIRRVQSRFADPHANHADAAKKEADLQRKIKEKMDALRQRVEQT
jgi:predicted RNA-binding Zn-ribbon protein involved in translation (DUF1610 family)